MHKFLSSWKGFNQLVQVSSSPVLLCVYNRLQIALLHANGWSHICSSTVHHTALVSSPSRTGTQCWVMSTSALFWGVGRDTCCVTSWLNQEGKLNTMNLLIIKNGNSQERSSPLAEESATVNSDYKTLEDAPVAGWGLYPSPELTKYSCLGFYKC